MTAIAIYFVVVATSEPWSCFAKEGSRKTPRKTRRTLMFGTLRA